MENKYHPLTAEEFKELEGVIDSIRNEIPLNQSDYIWGMYNKIRGANEPKPCTSGCGGAAAHWRRGFGYLTDWVKDRK